MEPSISLNVRQTGATGFSGKITVTSLEISGLELKQVLSGVTNLPVDEMKVLCVGKILKNDVPLSSQRIKPNSRLLVMKSAKKTHDYQNKIESDKTRAEKVQKAAENLASRVDGGDDYNENYYVELTNQDGTKINIPEEERKALVTAMALHTKGRTELDQGNISVALDCCLRADKLFQKCSAEIIDSIDNYGLLCLDIAWIYFKLQKMQYLKDGAWRLSRAKACLQKSHGINQERLIALKGGACPEFVIYIRLYLLQGILKLYSGSKPEAKVFFDKAKGHLNNMVVTDEDMRPLLEMGFSTTECRIGLRASSKNSTAAVQWLFNEREKLAAARREEKARMDERKQSRQWGKTKNGGWINTQIHSELVKMGFEARLAAEALKQTDNALAAALDVLSNNPQLLHAAIAAQSTYTLNDEDVAQVVGMGFTEELAKKQLIFRSGNIQLAVEDLLAGNIAMDIEIPQTDTIEDEETEDKDVDAMETDDNEEDVKEEDYAMEESDLIRNMGGGAYAHLDFTLTEEQEILDKFMKQLSE